MIELYELNPHEMTTPQEKVQCVSWFIDKIRCSDPEKLQK